ncbi:MAG: hypothetical protein GQF41_1884 [Candidatus Rifleibacterium amylolyticum]|nr:MAG: hypothetical protein GQF41_1884 [Candidatus Rifleibacterium amylolyticum]
MNKNSLMAMALFILAATNCLIAGEICGNFAPHYDLLIRPVSMTLVRFAVKGSVRIPADVDRIAFADIPWQKFTFSVGNVEQTPDKDGTIYRPEGCREASWQIDFAGVSALRPPKSAASDDEIYCLNNFPPNPEIITDKAAFYQIRFDLPAGYKAITFNRELSSAIGIQFQIARFQEPIIRKTKNFTFEYVFPENFSADEEYMLFLENTMEKWSALFGNPGFNLVRIGVIRRGEAKGEINGSPCGNLILLSRSALGGKVDLSGMAGLGITADDGLQFRKMVLAHELSHFWFGVRFTGSDGWMTEGIPQYLGMCAVRGEGVDQVIPLLKFTEYLDKMIPQDAIPGKPFSEEQVNYIRAYYQGSLALYRIGEKIGHEQLQALINDVFAKNPNPEFADFDSLFRELYPDRLAEWTKAWRL